MWRYYIGDQVYRAPRKDLNWASKYDPTHGTKGYGVYERIYPEHIAEQIERVGKSFQTDEDIGKLLKAVEATTKFWKAATLLHPSWTINDTIGNIFLAMHMGVDPAALVRHLPDAFRASRAHMAGDEATLSSRTFKNVSRDLPLADAIHQSVQGGSGPFEAMAHQGINGVVLPTGASVLRDPKAAFAQMHDNAVKALQIGADAERVSVGQALKQKPAQYLKHVLYDDAFIRRVWAPWCLRPPSARSRRRGGPGRSDRGPAGARPAGASSGR